MKISYGKNVYDKKEISSVVNTLKVSTQMGKSVANFEKKIGQIFSKKYSLMVNSGSSALILALNVLNFKNGSEIITPCLNFGTAVSAILLSGHKPIFVDINISTLQIDINLIEEKITKKTKALLIPNLIGNIPEWKKIRNLANKYKLKIIEDKLGFTNGFPQPEDIANTGTAMTDNEINKIEENNFKTKLKKYGPLILDPTGFGRKLYGGPYDAIKMFMGRPVQ